METQMLNDFAALQLKGNTIHSHWFQTVQKGGKADLLAINILADIVYWYKPTEVRDEATGQHIGWRKKYKADALQKDYNALSIQFGVTKRQIRDAVTRLEEIGVIKRDFRTIIQSGMTLNNVLFIHLNIEKLKEISYPPNQNTHTLLPNNVTPMTEKSNPCDENMSDLLPNNVTPMTPKRKTNTESTTESTTEREEKKTSRPKTSPPKTKYGDFVKLTDEEHDKLCNDFGENLIVSYIDSLNNYIGSSGKRYKSHYHTIRNWLSRDKIKPHAELDGGNNAQDKLDAELEKTKKILGLG